jgi:hypothetical protein
MSSFACRGWVALHVFSARVLLMLHESFMASHCVFRYVMLHGSEPRLVMADATYSVVCCLNCVVLHTARAAVVVVSAGGCHEACTQAVPSDVHY